MDGEAFLGPLPEDYQMVSVLDERVGTYKKGHQDLRDGRIHFNDPRLALTSADDYNEVLTDPDESQSRRLTAERLEERGGAAADLRPRLNHINSKSNLSICMWSTTPSLSDQENPHSREPVQSAGE